MKPCNNANTPQVTSWTYNARGEMVQKIYADGNSVNYSYNADGQLLTRTWARGIVTTYTYDNAGRATGYSYSDGVTPAVVITLDFLDRQSSITDAAGLRLFTYGSDHLQTGETIPYISGLTQTYSYDIFKRQKQLLLGNHYAVDYSYDVQGRPASIAFNGKTKNYSYVPGTSNLSGYNGVESGDSIMSASYSYDAHKRLTGITASVNGSTYTHGYTLNDKNQRTGITLADGKNWNFSYDNIGQVTGAMLNNSGNLLNTYSYNYDQIGNRIQAVKDNDTNSYTSNIVNQYTQINTSVPTYDQDGNMLTNGEWSYTWNGENRMILAQTTTRKVEFAYDYMGRCFERKEYTAANGSWNLDKTVYIVYDEYKQIAEYVNGELYQQYVWDVAGLDTVAFIGKNNSTYMYWTDGNKNVLKLFDATGVQASYSYDPFGKVTTAEGSLATDNPFRFSSEYHNDITGLVEYIYRKYDPVMGRWINRDPIEEQGGFNLYLMCCNNINDYYDNVGKWLSPTHRRLTRNAFANLVIVRFPSVQSGHFKSEFIEFIVKENVNTDKGVYQDNDSYHYTRKIKMKIADAQKAYKMTIADETRSFHECIKKRNGKVPIGGCQKALEHLGRLTHIWQDYYAHAVEKDDSWFGATPGKISGSPDSPKMIPVSFGGTSWGFRGGHGGAFRAVFTLAQRVEPGDRAEDADNRRNKAQVFTKDKLIKFLNQWIKPCLCEYDKM